jgi:hypothetical protein
MIDSLGKVLRDGIKIWKPDKTPQSNEVKLGRKLPMVAMFVNGSGQNEQSLERTFHRCFLPSFTSFD